MHFKFKIISDYISGIVFIGKTQLDSNRTREILLQFYILGGWACVPLLFTIIAVHQSKPWFLYSTLPDHRQNSISFLAFLVFELWMIFVFMAGILSVVIVEIVYLVSTNFWIDQLRLVISFQCKFLPIDFGYNVQYFAF